MGGTELNFTQAFIIALTLVISVLGFVILSLLVIKLPTISHSQLKDPETMAHMFLSHYKNWVSYAQIIMQDVQSINMKETLNYDLPFFIVTYPKNDDSRTIEVQIWRNKD